MLFAFILPNKHTRTAASVLSPKGVSARSIPMNGQDSS